MPNDLDHILEITPQENNNQPETTTPKKPSIGKIGAIVALFSILFLPIAGCRHAGMSGIEAIDSNIVSGVVKLLIILSISCAVIGINAKSAPVRSSVGYGGIAAILIGFAAAKQSMPAIHLKVGSYLGIAGFVALLTEGRRQKP